MANIIVNENQWNSITEDEQRKIIDGLRENGALQSKDNIVANPSAPEITSDTEFEPMWNPIKDICKAICDTTAAAGVAWCTANTAGLGLAACIAVAEGARQECRKRC